jgi:hypothetical protein
LLRGRPPIFPPGGSLGFPLYVTGIILSTLTFDKSSNSVKFFRIRLMKMADTPEVMAQRLDFGGDCAGGK